MKFEIRHEIRGRIRLHLAQDRLNPREAEVALYYFEGLPGVTSVKVYERTAGIAICYTGTRAKLLEAVRAFHPEDAALREKAPQLPARAISRQYQEKLVRKAALRAVTRVFLPAPLRFAYTGLQAVRYLLRGLKSLASGRLKVEALDAAAIGASLLRGDFDTAGSVMFLLGVGEILEEWTHKKSVADLAGNMSLRAEKVWLKTESGEVLVPITDVAEGDRIVVRMGTVIPLDGVVEAGEATVNQASMTGEAVPVNKGVGGYVYAGTAIETGALIIRVRKMAGATRFERIIHMIEDSEKLKSGLEGKAERLADALVPWSLGGTVLTWLFTRNVTKALSVLMVDFSCALKLAMPLAVLSAMREAAAHHITVKGGKYLEAAAAAETIVFDKTGTLTKAEPTVAEVVTFGGRDPDEMLRVAACLEEHFPHSVAGAVVRRAQEKGLEHREMHTKVEYIVAHGIASRIGEERVVVGSHHFVFEDERCVIPEGEEALFRELKPEYSHLFLAIGGCLAAVICIEDPLRPEARDVVRQLRTLGLQNIVMLTGDSERTASAVAERVGVDVCRAEVLPEDKAAFVKAEKKVGRQVIMVGDGINDSPALSEADVGIAISEGAELAREIADITISENDLYSLLVLRRLGSALMRRINRNYRFVIAFNLGLIALGIGGILQPATSALLHNTSTLLISLESMTDLLPD